MTTTDGNTDDGATGQDPAGSGNTGGTSSEKTPEWYENELKKTRAEAANYRTKLREAETKNQQGQAPDLEQTVAELKAQLAKQQRDLLVAKVGKDLPEELSSLLKGDTEEELAAHAETLRKFVTPAADTSKGKQGKEPNKLGGGLDPALGTDDLKDVASMAAAARAGRL